MQNQTENTFGNSESETSKTETETRIENAQKAIEQSNQAEAERQQAEAQAETPKAETKADKPKAKAKAKAKSKKAAKAHKSDGNKRTNTIKHNGVVIANVPRKGSKMLQTLKAMLRDKGATAPELREIWGYGGNDGAATARHFVAKCTAENAKLKHVVSMRSNGHKAHCIVVETKG